MLRRIRKMLGGKPAKPVVIEEGAPGQVAIKGPGVDLSVSLPYPDFPRQEPLLPIVLDSPACPYCGVIQDPPPTAPQEVSRLQGAYPYLDRPGG